MNADELRGTDGPATAAGWPDAADEIMGADQAIAFAYVTPAKGVVLTPVTNFALRDRDAGTLTAVNTSVGAWRKLQRLQQNPRVAVAYHTRTYSSSDRPEYVLVQGRVSIPSLTDPDAWFTELGENWERVLGVPREVGLWERWMSAYHWRVNLPIEVHRVFVFPDLRCRRPPEVHGAPRPVGAPPSQDSPSNGTGPRIGHTRAAMRARRLPHVLLGWVDSDGFPMIAPAGIHGVEPRGIVLEAPEDLLPPGARRAGLLAHWFARGNVPHRLRRHTGWLAAQPEPGRAIYAPHTAGGYALPRWQWSFKLLAGAGTRMGIRQARRVGVLPPP